MASILLILGFISRHFRSRVRSRHGHHLREVVLSFKFRQNRMNSFRDVGGGRNLQFPIPKASGLYNSLYYRTSRDAPSQRRSSYEWMSDASGSEEAYKTCVLSCVLLCGCDRDMIGRLECVFKARAQVMSRDESTQLWRPLHGGGMSVVELSRSLRAPVESDDVTDDAETYYIIGRKETDVSYFGVFWVPVHQHCAD